MDNSSGFVEIRTARQNNLNLTRILLKAGGLFSLHFDGLLAFAWNLTVTVLLWVSPPRSVLLQAADYEAECQHLPAQFPQEDSNESCTLDIRMDYVSLLMCIKFSIISKVQK